MRWKFWTKLLISLLLLFAVLVFLSPSFTTNTLAWPNTKPMLWVASLKLTP